jgi:enoyl-CoA hydratase
MARHHDEGAPETAYVRVERRAGVGVVTLNHPADRNALSLAMSQALASAVRKVSADKEVGSLVLAATPPVFSAGGSVDELLEPKAPLRELYAGFEALGECGLPSVAAVNGPALGAGMNLALACDVIICSPAAIFETRFLGIGLHPGGGHLWRLRERIGRQGAAALALFGESLDGDAAARAGLAWRCVPEDDLFGAAVALAERAASIDRVLSARVRSTLDESAALHRGTDAIVLELGRQQWSMERPEFAASLQRVRARLGRGAS